MVPSQTRMWIPIRGDLPLRVAGKLCDVFLASEGLQVPSCSALWSRSSAYGRVHSPCGGALRGCAPAASCAFSTRAFYARAPVLDTKCASGRITEGGGAQIGGLRPACSKCGERTALTAVKKDMTIPPRESVCAAPAIAAACNSAPRSNALWRRLAETVILRHLAARVDRMACRTRGVMSDVRPLFR